MLAPRLLTCRWPDGRCQSHSPRSAPASASSMRAAVSCEARRRRCSIVSISASSTAPSNQAKKTAVLTSLMMALCISVKKYALATRLAQHSIPNDSHSTRLR